MMLNFYGSIITIVCLYFFFPSEFLISCDGFGMSELILLVP